MKQISVIFLIFLFITNNGFSKNKAVRFQHLSIADGLSLSSVYCIHRDSKGYMWFGTEDGLNRYDGYHFKIFRTNVKESNSICYKWIEHIHEDSRGHLWFGSQNGLSHFNPEKENFTNFSFSQSKLVNDTITCLMQASDSTILVGTLNGLSSINIYSHRINNVEDIKGRINVIKRTDDHLIWICSSKGLFQFSPKHKSFSSILIPTDNKSMSFNSIVKNDSIIWLAGEHNLYRYNTQNKSLQTIALFSNKPNNEYIETIIEDQQNRLWVSTNFGLYSYNKQSKLTKQLVKTTNSSNSLAMNPQKPLTLDNNGVIWYGTHGDGLFLIYPNLQISHHKYNPVDKTGLSQNAINCIYNDSLSGNIFLGTFGAGLNIFNSFANKFDLIKHNPLDTNSLSSDFIWSIQEDKDGSLWIGSNDNGISHYTPSTGQFEFFDHQVNKSGSLSNSSVREIFQDSRNTIWAGTDGGGLNQLNRRTGTFKTFQFSKDDPNSISDNSVRVVFEDSHKQLWVGTKNGLNKFNPITNHFSRFKHDPTDPTSISNNFIYSSIIEDKNGYLWMGTYGGGLNRMNTKDETFKTYSTNLEPGKALSNEIVFSLYEDKNGLIWIGTNQGLNVLDPTNDSILTYSLNDGLPNEVIYGILPDSSDKLWLSTNRGISCFDPQEETFKNYDVHDGLQSNEFNGGAFHKGRSGRLYFGGVYGLNMLDPEKIQTDTNSNTAVLTHLEVLGKHVSIDKKFNTANKEIYQLNESMQMDKHITYTKEIILQYAHRFFSIEFSANNHLFPEKTMYRYQLYPMEDEWREAGNRNYVSYANIKPGTYTFKVKASNSEGIWPKEATEIAITVKPPFWLSYWFIAIEICLLIVVAVFILRFLTKIRINKALRVQNKRIKSVNLRLKESENNLKQINATKDRFFSIISHDLKNPFASVMSISDVLTNHYEESDEEDRKVCISRINASLKHMYSLLENLLTWSRSQRGVIEFKKTRFNLSHLITENINLNTATSQKKNIKLTCACEDAYMAFGDRDTINTIIRNLTSNALKYTNPGGTIKLSISEQEETHWLISIMDDGLGISEDNLEKLFSIDQKVKTDGTSGEKGTGLGLIICKEFSEKNEGTIGVNSQLGKGSTFWFTVPKAPK